jgi:hypothetical protein
MKRYKGRLVHTTEWAFDLSFPGSRKARHKKKRTKGTTSAEAGLFFRMPLSLQIMTCYGLVLYGILVAPVFEPTQTEIDFVLRLLS